MTDPFEHIEANVIATTRKGNEYRWYVYDTTIDGLIKFARACKENDSAIVRIQLDMALDDRQ